MAYTSLIGVNKHSHEITDINNLEDTLSKKSSILCGSITSTTYPITINTEFKPNGIILFGYYKGRQIGTTGTYADRLIQYIKTFSGDSITCGPVNSTSAIYDNTSNVTSPNIVCSINDNNVTITKISFYISGSEYTLVTCNLSYIIF